MFEEIVFKHAFQPVIDIDSSTIVSYEVLLRGPSNETPEFILDQVDMSILRSISNHGPRQATVKALCVVCKNLGIYIRVNGIETEHQFNFLRKIGISLFQGPLFAEPGFEFLPQPSFPASI
jgi:EAL domain-containing protein (putative c-di-GMP-specific phosphodiesterase class I)